MDDPGEYLNFLDRKLPARFVARAVRIATGTRLPYVEAEWRGALVVVERGAVELECLSGASRAFPRGTVLWLVGLPLRALHNRGPDPALLSVVTRSDEFPADLQLYR